MHPRSKLCRIALFVVCPAAVSMAQTPILELNKIPSAARLHDWHELVASEPHIAGTEGDARQIDRLARAFRDLGLETEVHEIWPLLSYPVSAEVEVLHPSIKPGTGLLPLKEQPLPEDPYSGDPGLTIGFNAYSGSGEAIGQVVYANFGTKQDFERLAELGVDCRGKIVIARFGGNFRGLKAKYAEAAGAAGLLIYLDPGDSGYVKGDVYPAGGWQTDMCIQRGSIDPLDYPGDPLTPFVEATRDAARLDPEDAGLPTIPVQPIGWGAARQILLRMEGDEAPREWQGGLPMSYRLTGGPDLRVRVDVRQERRVARTASVIGRLQGAEYPDEWVIVGCHHDAWNCGAADPTSGLISELEAARSFTELAKAGARPKRSILFCAWGAEEYGMIGSTEWVEAHADELRQKAVAYINLDMASMGPQFGAAATPSVRRLVEEAAGLVPQARSPEQSVLQDWVSRSARNDDPLRPSIGDLGGGSDHVGFVCHLGVPGISLGCGGSMGSSYHTAFDNLHWYRQVVGEDYEPALMIARMTNAVVGKLAYDARLPVEVAAEAQFIGEQLRAIREDPRLQGAVDPGALKATIATADKAAAEWQIVDGLHAQDGPTAGATAPTTFRSRALRAARDTLTVREGLPDRPWFENLLIATDPTSGYGSWTLPGLRGAIESGDPVAIAEAFARLRSRLEQLARLAEGVPGSARVDPLAGG
ncbi:MAG: M20/M25/M40 family metallo-hydrolase [Phycisphaerales bacterium]|nr:M20/M25/M40 family metallo-hydrolase [Phycisphaerales bacterium]